MRRGRQTVHLDGVLEYVHHLDIERQRGFAVSVTRFRRLPLLMEKHSEVNHRDSPRRVRLPRLLECRPGVVEPTEFDILRAQLVVGFRVLRSDFQSLEEPFDALVRVAFSASSTALWYSSTASSGMLSWLTTTAPTRLFAGSFEHTSRRGSRTTVICPPNRRSTNRSMRSRYGSKPSASSTTYWIWSAWS